MHPIVIAASGTSVYVDATSRALALPVASDGTKPYYVRVTSPTTGYINFGATSAVTVSSANALVTHVPTIFNVRAFKFFAALGSPEAAAAGSGATLQAHLQLQTLASNVVGTGYAVNDTVTVTGGAILKVTTINGSGGITGFTFNNRGDYTSIPGSIVQSATSGSGTSATFQTPTFSLASVGVTAGGTGYVNGATASIPAATTGGTPTITLTVVNGVVTAATPSPGTYVYATYPAATSGAALGVINVVPVETA